MNDETKRLIEDAARLLGLTVKKSKFLDFVFLQDGQWVLFNPFDRERGDLMKVADAAKLALDLQGGAIMHQHTVPIYFDPDDHDSLVLAVLRAASAVLKARGE